MRRILYILCFTPLLASTQNVNKKTALVDSLQQVIESAKHDTIVLEALAEWDKLIYVADPELDLLLNKQIDSICAFQLEKNIAPRIKKHFLDKKGTALNNIGIYYYGKGDYYHAINYYQKALKVYETIGHKKGIASCLNNIAVIANHRGDQATAISSYMRSLKIYKEVNSTKGIALTLNNIAKIYSQQKDYKKAIEYFEESIAFRNKTGDTIGIAGPLKNLGSVYMDYGSMAHKDGDIDAYDAYYMKALNNFNRALTIHQQVNNKSGIASSLYDVGTIHQLQAEIALSDQQKQIAQEKFNRALKYYEESESIQREIGAKKGLSQTLISLGVIYTKLNDYNKAYNLTKQALKLATEVGSLLETRDASEQLWKIHKKLGNAKESLEMYELFVTTSDSISSKKNQKGVIKQQYKYEYEKQAAADSVKAAEAAKLKDAQLAAQKAENQKQKQQAYFLYGGLAIALLFGGFIFNRFRVTNKQKGIIETQKAEVEQQREVAEQQRLEAENQKVLVEEKNREIVDSIQYAKRLQEAILPPTKIVKQWLTESFILYKPKDIVAGDFYWMETLGETVYFAAADCTGHGVPGAMVSVVCSNALSKALMEENITEPGKILDRTRELVIDRFGQSEEDIKDGMDIALCTLHSHTQTHSLKYAGANNPLWIIRKGAQEVEEIKADKQPIGKYAAEKPFTTHHVELNPGDSIYIFSDGYPDQFGGAKGKKYKSGKMKKFLLSIDDKDMATQREMLNKEFENWKGDLDQIDDICVMGVRI